MADKLIIRKVCIKGNEDPIKQMTNLVSSDMNMNSLDPWPQMEVRFRVMACIL